MSMSPQSQAGMAKRDKQFSNQQMRKYFTEKRYSRKMIVCAAVLGLISFLSLAFNGVFSIVGFFLCVCFVGYILIKARSIPTDKEYDEWVKRKRRALLSRAYKKLHLNQSHLIIHPLIVKGFILPGSEPAAHYSARDVYMKEGEDGQWRFSINVFMFFFATEDYLAVFSSSVNAVNQSAPPVEGTEEYFYDHIVGVTTYTGQDVAVIYGQEYDYRIQKFSLRIANRDNINLGAYIGATALGNSQHGPIIIPPTMNIDRVLAELRHVIRLKRKSPFGP